MGRKRVIQLTPPVVSNPFRTAERFYKKSDARTCLATAFDPSRIVWESPTEDGSVRGVWQGEGKSTEECWKVPLGDLAESGMGQSRWKGKEKEGEGDWAIIVPRIPGLVLFPSILPESLQRDLVVETLQHARRPNLTNLDPHYVLPEGGLWNAWLARRGEEVVPALKTEEAVSPGTGSGYDTPSTDAGSRTGSRDGREKQVTVRELLPKLRWSNVGFHYNWTTKLYEFERGCVPLPPLVHRSCRDIIRATPWELVFPGETANEESKASWRSWKEDYEPDAGIINFYQLKDSLTGHTDHSEVDAVRPLVSFSLGHSSIFLVGRTTKDVPPLAILLRSGDGLCMSGESRLAYHGLPRVLVNTLPSYLSSSQPEPVEGAEDWRPYGEYLGRGARMNVNVRSVF
ncbi:hypothetical protein JCM8547_003082 [Rhodosporidiobolus lusitaniae]